MEMSDRYHPEEVERKIYQQWMDQGVFQAEDVSTKPPYCIILPPPNVTGSLHLGHALDHTIQDVLIRWKRMSGFNALWLPGTDHAGIATQSVVEKSLKKDEGTTRQELGREKFVKRVWDWKEQYGSQIVEQMKRLGDSCDWNRHVFTLDEGVSKAVRRVFVQLYNKGYIYRGQRLINWSPQLESALSDLEVEHQEVKGNLWHFKYKIKAEDTFITVATTRPETMLGDTAVAVHPDDDRYQSLVGKFIVHPITGREFPIVADTYVDQSFGSGAVKITPAHDFNDYDMGKRHDLEFLNILNRDGTLNENAGKFKGLKVKAAREAVVQELEDAGLMEKIETHTHSVGHCSRTNCIVEPLLSEQWFVKMDQLVVPAKRVVESGTIRFEPESWTKTYLHWMNNIQDWCISRQLWWGHRIPAWYCPSCQHISVLEHDPEKCEKCGSPQITQDDDVLDTWFSSGLWPFTTMGWPEETEAQKTFYPTDVLVTGHDIIFFWVARMIVSGLEFKGDVPFRVVYLHGLIRDSQGRKMSKSLPNSVDPLEIIEKFGADALRFTLISQLSMGRDLKFSTQRLEGYRNFMNKIWNASRFALSGLKDFKVPSEGAEAIPAKADLSEADKWIVFKLKECEEEVESALENFRFSDAAQAVYNFTWHQFCDWYLEFIKPIVYGQDSPEKQATQLVLAQTLNRIMRLLHPFIPFITEEIFQKLPIRSKSLALEQFPSPKMDENWTNIGSQESAVEMDVVIEVISAIRNIRGENRINPGAKITTTLVPHDDKAQKILGANKLFITTLAKLKDLEVGEVESMSKCAVTPVRYKDVSVDVVVPLEGLVDIEEEVRRIRKNVDKTQKEIDGINKRLTNKNFVDNAPDEVVEQAQKQLDSLKSQVGGLQESLSRLQS